MSTDPLGITVASPCAADWDSMAGSDQVRFCTHCEKHIHNLSEMTRGEALRLVRSSGGNLCVRYYRRPDGRVASAADSKLHKITRRASRIAAGAFGAAVSLGASVAAHAQAGSDTRQVVELRRAAAEPSAERVGTALAGNVLDPNGAFVAGAAVTLSNRKTGESVTTATDAAGSYRFESLAPGAYRIAFEAEGFARAEVERVEVSRGVEQRQDSTLGVNSAAAALPQVSNGEGSGSSGASRDAPQDAQDGAKPKAGEQTEELLVVNGGLMIMIQPSDPVVTAAFTNDLPAAKNLIALGADVNVLDRDAHTTALIQAALHGNAEMVSALLGAGADVNAKDTDGDTALTSINDAATAEMVRALISKGAKVNHRNGNGVTPLINAAEYDSPRVLKELLDAGAKVNAKTRDGTTALMQAAIYGRLENVRLLLHASADVNAKDKEGATALKLLRELEETASGTEEATFEVRDGSEASEDSEEAEASKESKESAESNEPEEPDVTQQIINLLLSYGAVE